MEVWDYLNTEGYIVNGQFTKQCERGIELGIEIFEFQGNVNEIYLLSKDVWKDVWETGAQSAVLGGVLSGLVSTGRHLDNKQSKQITKRMNIKQSKPKHATAKVKGQSDVFDLS